MKVFAFVDLFASLFFLTLTLNQELHSVIFEVPKEEAEREDSINGTEILVKISAKHLLYKGEKLPADAQEFWTKLPQGSLLLSLDPSVTTHQFAKIQGTLQALEKPFTTVLEVQK